LQHPKILLSLYLALSPNYYGLDLPAKYLFHFENTQKMVDLTLNIVVIVCSEKIIKQFFIAIEIAIC
jgi:hypothetical protein